MNRMLKGQRRYTLMTSLVLSLSLWIAPMVLANYRPPKNPSAPRGTGTNTTRGDDFCGSEATGAFTALAPLSHLGQTTSPHPTFAWFIPDAQAAPIKFTLYAAATQSPIFETEVPARPGLMQLTLPSQKPGLQPGRYRWQVVRICSPKRLEAVVEFEVVKPSANLEEHWYDALADALNHPNRGSANAQVISLLSDLQMIEAAAATAAQTPNWKTVLTKQSNNLKQIIDLEQKPPLSQSR